MCGLWCLIFHVMSPVEHCVASQPSCVMREEPLMRCLDVLTCLKVLWARRTERCVFAKFTSRFLTLLLLVWMYKLREVRVFGAARCLVVLLLSPEHYTYVLILLRNLCVLFPIEHVGLSGVLCVSSYEPTLWAYWLIRVRWLCCGVLCGMFVYVMREKCTFVAAHYYVPNVFDSATRCFFCMSWMLWWPRVGTSSHWALQ